MSDRDALAASIFAAEWAKWADAMGEKARRRRSVLRKNAEIEAKMALLRVAGATCGTCGSFRQNRRGGTICDMDSDFYGTTATTADNLCSRWHARGNANV
jgi:hypothetical protein